MRFFIKSDKVKNPGVLGGRYYFDKHGNVRYGEQPTETRRVTKVYLPAENPYPEGHPLHNLFRLIAAAGSRLDIHTPSDLHDFLVNRWWMAQGISAEDAEAKWQDFVETTHADGHVEYVVKEDGAVAPIAAVQADPKLPLPRKELKEHASSTEENPDVMEIYTELPEGSRRASLEDASQFLGGETEHVVGHKRRQVGAVGTSAAHEATHKIWDTLDLSHLTITEAEPYKARGIPLTLKDGTKIKLTPDLEHRAWLYAVSYKPRGAPGGGLHKVWHWFDRNFTDDFSKALGRQVDLSQCNWKAFEYAHAQEEKKKEADAIAGKNKKAKKAPTMAIVDGEEQPCAELKLMGAGAFTGADPQWCGRWRRAMTMSDIREVNCTKPPKNWKGKVVQRRTSAQLIYATDPLDGGGTGQTLALSKKSATKQKRKMLLAEGVSSAFHAAKANGALDKAVVAAINSSDPDMQEIGLICAIMDSTHMRMGNKAEAIKEMRQYEAEGEPDREPSVGVTSLLVRHLQPDGHFSFLGKKHVPWDSKHKVSLKLPGGDKTESVGLNPAVLVQPGSYDARPIYQRLTRGKKPGDFLFSVKNEQVNDFIKAAIGVTETATGEHVAHTYRHFWGTHYYLATVERFGKQLDNLVKKHGKGSPEVKKLFKEVDTFASEFAGSKLGHRKDIAGGDAGKKARERRLRIAEGKAKAEGKKLTKEQIAKIMTPKVTRASKEVNASTTRGSYMDFHHIISKTFPRWGVDFRSTTEKTNTSAYGFEEEFGIPTGKEPKAGKKEKGFKGKKSKKAKKGALYIDLVKADPTEFDPLALNGLTGPDEMGHPSLWWYFDGDRCGDVNQHSLVKALRGGRAERAGKTRKDFDAQALRTGAKHEEEHTDDEGEAEQIAMDHLTEDPRYYAKLAKLEKAIRIAKAIGTKQSEEMKGPKKAPPPTKSSAQKIDPKNGKKRYEYKGQTPDKGGAGKGQAGKSQEPSAPGKGGASDQDSGQKPSGAGDNAAQGQDGAPPPPPPPPPQIDVQELATALQVTVGTISAFVRQFKDANRFVGYCQQTIRPFLAKHSIGADQLRRLYEQLNPPKNAVPPAAPQAATQPPPQ